MKLRKIILLIATALLIILLHYSVRADWINATLYNETFEAEDYLNISESSVWIDLNANRHWSMLSLSNTIIADEYFDNQTNNTAASGWDISTGQIVISDAYKNGSAGYSAHIFSSIGELYPRKSYSNYPLDNFSVEFDIYMAQQEPVVMELDVGDYISKAQILFGNEANVHKYISKTTTLSKNILYNTWYSVKLNFSNTAESIYYNNILLGTLSELQVSNPGAENGIAFNTLGSGTEVNNGIYMDNLRIYTGNSLAYLSSAVLAGKLLNYSAEIERVSLAYYGSVPSGTEVNCYVKSNVTGENWKQASNNTLVEINLSRGIYYFCNLSTSDITVTPTVNNIIIEAVPANVITECTNISSPGKYYLANNIINATINKCINISADNVTLDCRNYVIDGNGSSFGMYVARPIETATNITVQNCVLSDWGSSAIYLENADYNIFENISLSNNSNNGISLHSSSNVTLRSFHVNASAYGINIFASSNTTISEATANYNAKCGLNISLSDNTIITDATLCNNKYGACVNTSTALQIYGSNISQNDEGGIFLYRSLNATVKDTILNANLYGIISELGSGTVLDNLEFFNNSLSGIDITLETAMRINASNISESLYGISMDNCSYINISECNIHHNQYDGCYVESSSNNMILSTNFTNTTYGIHLDSGVNNTILRVSIRNSSYGLYVDSGSFNTLNASSISDNLYGTYFYETSDNEILSTNFMNNTYAVYITSSSNNAVTGSFLNNSSCAISFDDASSNNQVNRSSITNNENGVCFDTSNNNTIQDSNITNNAKGITFSVSSNNRIFNNVLNNSNNAYETYPENFWNTSLITSANIINGAYLAGNFWASPDGTGYSENCTDLNANGICDDYYNLSENNVDYLPLAYPDLKNPLIIFEVPTTADGSTTTTTITANVSVSDNNLINITCNLYSSTGVINQTNSTSSPFYVEFSGLSIGTYYLNATAIDSYNNRNSTETRIITITTAPLSPAPTGGGTNRGGSSAVIQKKEEEPKIPEQKPPVTKTEKKNADKTNEATGQSESQQQMAAPQNPLISGAAVQNANSLQVIPLESGWIGISFAVLILVFIIIRREHERIHSMEKRCSIMAKQKNPKKTKRASKK
jgi:parallel beta-helix repeat protein